MRYVKIVPVVTFQLMSLLASSSIFAAESIVIQGTTHPFPGTPNRSFKVYTVEEVDAKLNSINQSVSSATSSLNEAQNNFVTKATNDSLEFKKYIKNEVETALSAMPNKLFSEGLKTQLATDIAERISGQLETELAKMKADLKKELLEAIKR